MSGVPFTVTKLTLRLSVLGQSAPGAVGNSTRQSHHKPEMWPLFPVGILAISDFIWIVNIPHIYLFVYVCVHGFEQAFWNFTYLLPGYNILHLLKPLFKALIHPNQKHTHKPGSWQSCFRRSSLWSVLGKSYIINSSLSISLIVFGRLWVPHGGSHVLPIPVSLYTTHLAKYLVLVRAERMCNK